MKEESTCGEDDSGELNKDSQNVGITEENTLRMLELFQQEYQYRHQFYWNLSIKLFFLTLFVTMLPFIGSAFGATVNVEKFPIYFFPIVGVLLSFICYMITQGEVKRLSAVGKAKYEINKTMDEIYRYRNIDKNVFVGSKKKMASLLPKLILIFQLCVAAIEFYVIYVSYLRVD